ncbi:ActS/PrrB/RegB family redox-sensitive histidine kinase [Rhodoligotrophos defluvii]|uniref:ActS/PrrB/RegB family redox-sensitive histidine kinase n=1 Tax=Rhodoligotrophos defluvii TaxID=2561934 RepID=UPI001EF00E98|nr:ActS/PrrB/RegB family redox-sensitive histidine kinase [Rhodoligotrophos defluvii]
MKPIRVLTQGAAPVDTAVVGQTFHDSGGRLRLQTLVRLRWLAVSGQSAAVLAVYFWLGFHLPLGLCLGVIALSAWLNIWLGLKWPSTLRLSDRYAAMLLGYDVVQLAVLLYLTGGLQNPFAFLFVVPVSVSASSLPVERTVALSALCLGAVSLLTVYHMPLPWYPGQPLELPRLYVAGMWTAVVSGTVFAALYSRFIAEEARRMSAALSATEMALAREQKLSALDGLAAAAAHELGTPLATIALVAKELRREMPDDERFREDLELLSSQTERCRVILARLANQDAVGDHVFDRLRLKVMIQECAEPVSGSDVEVVVDCRPAPYVEGQDAAEPVFLRSPGIRYGLGNLLDNAVDFAQKRVEIEARWDAERVVVTLRDDGPGFAQDIMDKIGEPYVTSRRGAFDRGDGGHDGMGLGFFIAKTLLERSGATVTLANRPPPDHGATVRIEWQRNEIDLLRTNPGMQA